MFTFIFVCRHLVGYSWSYRMTGVDSSRAFKRCPVIGRTSDDVTDWVASIVAIYEVNGLKTASCKGKNSSGNMHY